MNTATSPVEPTQAAEPGAAGASGTSTAAAPEKRVTVRVEDLVVGRKLNFPVYDQRGVLLLAAGMEIDPRLRALLKERQIQEIQVHQDDAARVTLSQELVDPDAIQKFDTELTRALDSMISAGSLFVANTGTAVRDQMVIHGCKAYDQKRRQLIIEQQKEMGASLDSMMQGALSGSVTDGREITNITARFLTQVTTDADNVITAAAEAGRDASVSQHCLQMSLLGMVIGVEMGLDESNVRLIGLCGLVHDWGLTRVSDAIRNSPYQLNNSEMLAFKKHPIYSLELLQKISGIPSVVPIVAYQVHEAPNGSGYPRGRRGESIHQFARILSVADMYVGMTTHRPFRKALMPYAAMECLIRKARNNSIDPNAVRALLQVTSLFPIGSFVALSDGSVARVLRRNTNNYTKPIVQVVQDSDGRKVDPQDDSNILNLLECGIDIQQALPTPGRDEIGLSDDLIFMERV